MATTPNKNRETEYDRMTDALTGVHSKRMNALLTTMEDADFVVAYFKALEYAKPKLQRQELSGSVQVNKVTIERVDIPIDKIKENE